MSAEQLEADYREYLELIRRFYRMPKIQLALLLARFCRLEPWLKHQADVEMPAIEAVSEYAESQVNQNDHAEQTHSKAG